MSIQSTKPVSKTPRSTPKQAELSLKPRRLEDIAVGRKGCFCITPTFIRIEPGFNERNDYGDLKQLAADIEANGLLQPVKVRKVEGTETIYLVDGHRRFRAITEILIPGGRWPVDPKDESRPAPIDCISSDRNASSVDLLFMQISMNSGKNLTLMEKSRLYARILAEDSTMTATGIARRIGETKQAVSDALRLHNEACPRLVRMIESGQLAASTALHIIKQAGPVAAAQVKLLDAAVAAAALAGRDHLMPKDVPGPSDPPELPGKPTAANPPPATAGTTAPRALSTAFHLHEIPDAPREAQPDGTWHETDRLVLETRPAGITRLHLLAALTAAGPAYGFRIDDLTGPVAASMPREDHPTTGSDHTAGLSAMLAEALATIDLQPGIADQVHRDLKDAITRYFCPPDDTLPEEPSILPFVAIGTTQTQKGDPGAIERIKSAGSSNRDGSGVSLGNDGGFTDPAKRLGQLNKLLEELTGGEEWEDGHGDKPRITTANLIYNFLMNEASPAALRKHLQGK